MRVGVIGLGAMGGAMAGHIAASGDHEVHGYDLEAERVQAAAATGVIASPGPRELAAQVELALVIVATDPQVDDVCAELIEYGAPGLLIVVASTNHPATMREIAGRAAAREIRFIDAPVVFGLKGAHEATLVSLCGGSVADVDRARPVLGCYSRAVQHMGEVGAGQLTKTVNNMLHWSACVANFEAISLGKTYGLDGQRLREVLLDCPAANGTLRDWDSARFTWHEKDLDIALDLAQSAGLVLPLFGQVDQLVKNIGPGQVRGLLHEAATEYLGRAVRKSARI